MYAGTYNANQIALAASTACLSELKDGSAQKLLLQNGKLVAQGYGVEAHAQAIGGKFQPYFMSGGGQAMDYRSAATSDSKKYPAFASSLFDSGVFVSQSHLFHHGLSLAHSADDLERIAEAFDAALKSLSLAR